MNILSNFLNLNCDKLLILDAACSIHEILIGFFTILKKIKFLKNQNPITWQKVCVNKSQVCCDRKKHIAFCLHVLAVVIDYNYSFKRFCNFS